MPTPEELERAGRAARRAALRVAHPDLGGSPEALRSVLAANSPAPAVVRVEFAPARLRTARRRVRVATTALRSQLPRHVPGALRRFTL